MLHLTATSSRMIKSPPDSDCVEISLRFLAWDGRGLLSGEGEGWPRWVGDRPLISLLQGFSLWEAKQILAAGFSAHQLGPHQLWFVRFAATDCPSALFRRTVPDIRDGRCGLETAC